MVLEIIKREIEVYKSLITSSNYREIYKWEALKNFQDNWNLGASDFKTMYDNSLYSERTDNLWANPHWFPKAVMIRFIEYNGERIRKMFQDLFNEVDDIETRIERFVFHCDKIREEIYSYDKSMKNHFHDGQRMVTLYLAFRFPEKYAIYKFTEFKTFMEIVKSTNIPRTGEHNRFFKVVRILYSILVEDEKLVRIHHSLLNKKCFKGNTLMLAQDFIFKIARRYMKQV